MLEFAETGDRIRLTPTECPTTVLRSSQVQELQLSVPGWLHGNPLHRVGCPRGRTGMSNRSCKSMDPHVRACWDPVRNIPVSDYRVGPCADGTHNPDPSAGWGDVHKADRPLWSRYMIDYCPSFPRGMLMSSIDNSVKDITTRIPQVWKQTAAELHSAGFTPLHYYLLAELLADLRSSAP